MESKTIKQEQLTSECWGVQVWGPQGCEKCEYKDHDDCGGKEIRVSGKNSNGFKVPLTSST